MTGRKQSDSGQAFPIYIMVVAGLLFLAFAYLAVGQAAASRNGVQTAANAAALAAAQDRRDQLAGMWLTNVLDPTLWQDIFDGTADDLDPSCWRAEQFADRNDAHLENGYCDLEWWPLGYTVKVKSNDPVGDSIVPGTEHKYARATATAVITSRCSFREPEDPADKDAKDPVPLPELNCKGRSWHLDPEHLTDLPGPEDLFDVHLADDK